MAGIKDGDDFKDGEFFRAPQKLKLVCLGTGVVGLLLFFGLRLAMPGMAGAMGYSWLFAVTFFLSLAVGGLFWVLLHNATNSGWGVVVRRLMEQLAVLLPFVLLLGLPLLIPQCGFRDALWEWFPERVAALEVAEEKAQNDLQGYLANHEASLAELRAELTQTRAELAGIESPSPGHRAHFDAKIQGLEQQIDKLEVHDASDEAALQRLTEKHFLHESVLLYVKRDYLNPGAWYFRFVLYLGVLGGIAWTLRHWSVKQDLDGDPRRFRWMRRWSCGFLPFFAAAWTFLVVDWLMALDYKWFSTMWGVYIFAGCALNSLGLLVIVLTALRKAGYLRNVVTLEHYHLMGKLMHAFVIFWAYIAFSQFFLIWYANITEETQFYLMRNTAFWNTYTIAFLVAGHFFVPFVVLLVRQVKKMPMVLSAVAGWNLLMHVLDMYWIIIPERGPSLTVAAGEPVQMTIPGAWVFDIIAFIAVGGIFAYLLLRQLSSASLFPCRDPRLDESLNVVN